MYNNIPLTQEQSNFAADHHNIVFDFLKSNGYAEDDYYDVVIFGYLQAVKDFSGLPEFAKFAFFRMQNEVNYYKKKETNSLEIVPLSACDDAGSYPSPELTLIERENICELINLSRSSQTGCTLIPFSEIYAEANGLMVA